MRNLIIWRRKWWWGLSLAVAIGAAGWAVRDFFHSDQGPQLSARRIFVDSTTGQAFSHTLTADEAIPVLAPSGGRTGFPAEPCYWTADGKAKPQPTWVLISMWKGSREPTFCPDCGRLVVGHNPPPRAGRAPPPTRAEYYRNHHVNSAAPG